MHVSNHHERTLTELDHTRLLKLTRQLRSGAAWHETEDIEDALEMARLVPSRSVSPDIVTMYSQVRLQDSLVGSRYQLTLCYPSDADPSAGFVSVTSPVGASLLGLCVGATARWVTPSGEARAAEVLAVLFQPEASGDYTL